MTKNDHLIDKFINLVLTFPVSENFVNSENCQDKIHKYILFFLYIWPPRKILASFVTVPSTC
jgi:hypothetical protein